MSISIEQTDAGVDDWIDGASFVHVRVEIHRDPAMWADLGPLYAQIDAAEQRLTELQAVARRVADDEGADHTLADATAASGGDVALGDEVTTPQTIIDAQAALDELIARAEDLYARYDANKETWTLRALEQEEVQAIVDEVRAELDHGDPPNRRTKETSKRYAERVAAWQKVMVEQVKPEVDVRGVAAAVVGVNVAGVEKAPPSVDGIRRLRKRPHGERHFKKLTDALEAISLQEVAIPAPHRRGA